MTGMVGWAVSILLGVTGTELGTVVDPKFVAEPPLPVFPPDSDGVNYAHIQITSDT